MKQQHMFSFHFKSVQASQTVYHDFVLSTHRLLTSNNKISIPSERHKNPGVGRGEASPQHVEVNIHIGISGTSHVVAQVQVRVGSNSSFVFLLNFNTPITQRLSDWIILRRDAGAVWKWKAGSRLSCSVFSRVTMVTRRTAALRKPSGMESVGPKKQSRKTMTRYQK